MTDGELYEIYNRTVGKVRSGTKIENRDYGTQTVRGLIRYQEDGQTAVTVGVEDAMSPAPIKTKTELVAEVRRRLS